jgi:hypothetical protein
LLSATDAAGLEEEARRIILSGRKSEVLQRFFADLKGKAKVVKYL